MVVHIKWPEWKSYDQGFFDSIKIADFLKVELTIICPKKQSILLYKNLHFWSNQKSPGHMIFIFAILHAQPSIYFN